MTRPRRPRAAMNRQPDVEEHPALCWRRRSGAVAGRDARHRAAAGAGRRLDRGAGGRRRPAGRPAARPGEFAANWMRVIPDLVTTHRVVAPDLPGHGASAVADGPLDAERVLALAGRADRARPARRRRRWWGTASAAPSRPASPSTTATGSAGWCSWTPSAWAVPSRRRVSRLALDRFLAQPTERTHDVSARSACRPGRAARSDGRAVGAARRRTPSTGPARRPAGRPRQPHGAARDAGDPAGGPGSDRRAHDPDLGTARPGRSTAGRRGRERPLRMAAAGDRGRRRRPRRRAARAFLRGLHAALGPAAQLQRQPLTAATARGRPATPPAPERFDTVVIGAGQAGLRSAITSHGEVGLRDPGRQPAGRRLLAPPLGLAPPVHPRPLRRAARHALPRTGLVLPHQGRDRRLPGGLRGDLRPSGPHRRQRGPAVQRRRPVRGDRRQPPVGGRPRGGGHRAPTSGPGPGIRRRLDPGIVQLHSVVPDPSQLPRRRRAGGGRRQLRRRDRLRGLPHPPDLAVGPGYRPHPGPQRQQVGSADHPAVLVVRLAGADRADPDRPQGPSQGPDHDRAAGTGAAQGARRGRGRAGAEDGRGQPRPPVLADGRVMDVPPSSGAPGSDPTSPGSTSRSSTRTAPRHTTAASSDPSPACTFWACGSSMR